MSLPSLALSIFSNACTYRAAPRTLAHRPRSPTHPPTARLPPRERRRPEATAFDYRAAAWTGYGSSSTWTHYCLLSGSSLFRQSSCPSSHIKSQWIIKFALLHVVRATFAFTLSICFAFQLAPFETKQSFFCSRTLSLLPPPHPPHPRQEPALYLIPLGALYLLMITSLLQILSTRRRRWKERSLVKGMFHAVLRAQPRPAQPRSSPPHLMKAFLSPLLTHSPSSHPSSLWATF